MENGFVENIITLIDEEGKETNFDILDSLEYEGRLFHALFPLSKIPDDWETYDDKYMVYYIFESKAFDSGNESYFEELEDGKLHDELAEIFEERFNEQL